MYAMPRSLSSAEEFKQSWSNNFPGKCFLRMIEFAIAVAVKSAVDLSSINDVYVLSNSVTNYHKFHVIILIKLILKVSPQFVKHTKIYGAHNQSSKQATVDHKAHKLDSG